MELNLTLDETTARTALRALHGAGGGDDEDGDEDDIVDEEFVDKDEGGDDTEMSAVTRSLDDARLTVTYRALDTTTINPLTIKW